MDRIRKLFSRIPKKHRLQLLEALACLHDPACAPTLHIDKLTGSNKLRIRAGSYRIIFHKNAEGKLVVDQIMPRNEQTYRDV